jgi:hypothetical protein
VGDKLSLPMPSAWEPISVTLHKIKAQCDLAATWHTLHQYSFIRLSTYATVPINSQPANSVQHIHNIWAIDCLRQAGMGHHHVPVQRNVIVAQISS